MAFPRSTPLKHVPAGLSDALDGTNAPAGAMALLSNLIPDPTTKGVFVPRPAATLKIDFAAGGFISPGEVTGYAVVGDIVYGMIPSGLVAGKDQPWAYDLANDVFLVVNGIVAANMPDSPPETGEWTPPIVEQIGSRIIVCHPGFPGGAIKFGWFDISGFGAATVGNTNSSTTITGNPTLLAVQPGMAIIGAGITGGTTIVSTAEVVLVQFGDTHTSTLIDNLPISAVRAVGQTVEGVGIPVGATITALTSTTSVTISAAATATATVSLTFGGATLTLSVAATASANGVALTIAGGTRIIPLWGAGDTDRNPLLSVPVGVAQMAGRAWFADGLDGIPWSDSGFACRRTSGAQALTTNDGLAVTAIAPLLLVAPLTGGIVQAMIAFQGVSKMQQIIGDPSVPATATTIAAGGRSTLSMNLLPVATGTLAPLSIEACELGTAFVSPEGLRFIKHDGTVTPPMGDRGNGVDEPFIFAVGPSRIVAAASSGVLRITVKNGTTETVPLEEYWFDLTRKIWSGPHTSTAGQIQGWQSSFLMGFAGVPGKLYQSDAHPGLGSIYIERDAQLSWAWRTVMLPDSSNQDMSSVVEMTLTCRLAPDDVATVVAISDFQMVLDQTTVTGDSEGTIWGAFQWNEARWGAHSGTFRQRPVNWHEPLVFKQVSFLVQGQSQMNVKVGNLYMRRQHIDYNAQEAS